MTAVAFYALGSLSVLAGLSMITRRSPLASALSLLTLLAALAGVFLLLEAQFLGIVQILVYAGAIAVLVLFVLMMVDLDAAAVRAQAPRAGSLAAGVVVGAAITAAVLRVVLALPPAPAAPIPADSVGTARSVGAVLLTGPLLYPFEIVSLLLLVAVAGAVALAKRKV
ncbi:MAG: NADH-quinone oxidoreductase subunit J [Planctomycetales bacterium]|nr:NADH-quinone oxidoreductase subunit J [Planctomycetales bacterium]